VEMMGMYSRTIPSGGSVFQTDKTCKFLIYVTRLTVQMDCILSWYPIIFSDYINKWQVQ
jgi:hypothetical protein